MKKVIITLALAAAIAYIFIHRGGKREVTTYENITPEGVVPLEDGDSLYMFRDTVEGRWSAEVSGRDVELRSLVLVDDFERGGRYGGEWDVALRTGVSRESAWYGVGLTRRWDRFSVSVDGGYDWAQQRPYMGVSASVVLFSE